MKIEDMDFTVRTYHVLKRAGINTTEEVQRMTDDDLYRLRNIGKLTFSEIRSKLPYIPPEKFELLPVQSFADKIRAMTDEELCDAIFQLIYAMDPATWFCKGKKECGDLMDADKEIPDEMCKACLLAKLRQPADEHHRPIWPHEDKQESGLIEED